MTAMTESLRTAIANARLAEMARSEVAAGMALLDSHRPNWRRLVDPASIDIGDGAVCALGQIFGSYSNGLQYLHDRGATELNKHGFHSSAGGPGHSTLTAQWKEMLAA